MKEIYPNVVTAATKLKIPMPGHSVSTEQAVEEMKADYLKLNDLIKEHDVIFLITDSRES